MPDIQRINAVHAWPRPQQIVKKQQSALSSIALWSPLPECLDFPRFCNAVIYGACCITLDMAASYTGTCCCHSQLATYQSSCQPHHLNTPETMPFGRRKHPTPCNAITTCLSDSFGPYLTSYWLWYRSSQFCGTRQPERRCLDITQLQSIIKCCREFMSARYPLSYI